MEIESLVIKNNCYFRTLRHNAISKLLSYRIEHFNSRLLTLTYALTVGKVFTNFLWTVGTFGLGAHYGIWGRSYFQHIFKKVLPGVACTVYTSTEQLDTLKCIQHFFFLLFHGYCIY